jgi:hypothetical protein
MKSYTYHAQEPEPEKKKPALIRPQIVGRRSLIRAGVFILRLLAVLAVVASFIGTYFGARGQQAPTNPAQLWGALGDGGAWALALGLQALLTLGQWAARAQLVTIWQRGDPYGRLAGWIALYGACLGISLNFNFVAWYTPLTLALGSGFAAAVTIIASDILPEWLLVE